MLNYAASFIVYFFEMLISYIVFSYISDKKKPTVIIFIFGLIIFEFGAAINIIFSNTVWINSIYTFTSTLIFAILCFHIRYSVAVVYVILMCIFSAALEFATIFVISALSGASITGYNYDQSLLLMEASISKTLYLISCIILVRLRRRGTSLDKVPRSFYFFPICVLFSLVSFWYISVHESLNHFDQILLSVTSIVLFGATVLLFITYQYGIKRDIEYLQIKSENDRLQLEKAYYDILERQNQQLMIYSHDTKNHLAAIRSLSTDPGINAYIQKLLDQLSSYTNSCHSGNKILDVIINKYVTECELRGVAFDYDIKSCNLGSVEDTDLVSILGNLMDNALTAAEKSREKHILLETTVRNSYSVIIIRNSCDQRPEAREAHLLTTKEEKHLHGFGLKSVKKTLKKYQGDYSWDYYESRHVFVVTVMIGNAGR